MRSAAALLLLSGWAWDPAVAQWTESPAHGWIQASTYIHPTSRRFDENGRISSLFSEGGQSTSTSLFLSAVAGVVNGVDVGFQIPFHRLSFDDAAAERTSTGFGDPSFQVRLGHRLAGLDLGSWAVAVRGGVKLKGGSFPIDAEIIPLTDGQRDYELALEVGRSFWPFPAYAVLWTGYRWRMENRPIRKRPGNEVLVYAAAGGSLRRWTWKISMNVLDGGAPEFFSIEVPSARREIAELLPMVGRMLGPGEFSVGVRVPVAGRNLPAGPAIVVGYFARFSLIHD